MLFTESPQHPACKHCLHVPQPSTLVTDYSCCDTSACSSAFHLLTLPSYLIPVSSLLCHCCSRKSSMFQTASFPALYSKVTFTCISAWRLPPHPSLHYLMALEGAQEFFFQWMLPLLQWFSVAGISNFKDIPNKFYNPTRSFPSNHNGYVRCFTTYCILLCWLYQMRCCVWSLVCLLFGFFPLSFILIVPCSVVFLFCSLVHSSENKTCPECQVSLFWTSEKSLWKSVTAKGQNEPKSRTKHPPKCGHSLHLIQYLPFFQWTEPNQHRWLSVAVLRTAWKVKQDVCCERLTVVSQVVTAACKESICYFTSGTSPSSPSQVLYWAGPMGELKQPPS